MAGGQGAAPWQPDESSSIAFVEALRSTVAIISAGRDHAFGHPHPEVVMRYEAAGAVVLATGDGGAVAVCTDGRGLAASTHDGRRIAWDPSSLGVGVDGETEED